MHHPSLDPGPPSWDQLLTKREQETLPHLVNGKSNQEIATILGISRRTAEKHVAAIIRKAGSENRKMLIAEARDLESNERSNDG